MSYWINDPELFLYVKGTGPDDVHLWRCKKPTSSLSSSSSSSSSLVVPMKSDDFDFVKIVKNHLELIAYMDVWDEPDYNRLVKYIYEKRFLVNIQGFVIAELLHKADKDGNNTTDDASEEDVPAIYIRSLDVLPLKPYIPNLTERSIPLRTVKYLGDVNGKVAMMEEDSDVTKLTARVADLESKNKTLDDVTKLTAGLTARVVDLESKNKTLDTNDVTKLTTGLTARVADLESKNKTLDTNVTKLTAGLTARVAGLESKNKTLEVENKTLEGKVRKLTADLVTQVTALTTLQQQVKNINANNKEVWMNDLTNSEWVGVEGLRSSGPFNNLIIVNQPGTFRVDNSSTNVRARYWYKIKIPPSGSDFEAISIDDLTPNKERARFLQDKWVSFKSNGKTYVF